MSDSRNTIACSSPSLALGPFTKVHFRKHESRANILKTAKKSVLGRHALDSDGQAQRSRTLMSAAVTRQ